MGTEERVTRKRGKTRESDGIEIEKRQKKGKIRTKEGLKKRK